MSKVEVKYFSSFYVDKLYRKIAGTEDFTSYNQENFLFEEIHAKGPTEIYIDSNFKLDPAQGDLENSIILYEALKDLTEVQASDERLWVYLAHNNLWPYMKERWPIDDAKNALSRIKERYFLRTLSLESLTRNGLARLWWYAHIAIDTKRQNKYELLEIMLQRQDLVVQITERAFGANNKILVGLLEFFKENPEISGSQHKTREILKGLNLTGGVKMLPFLEINEIKDILNKISISIAA